MVGRFFDGIKVKVSILLALGPLGSVRSGHNVRARGLDVIVGNRLV